MSVINTVEKEYENHVIQIEQGGDDQVLSVVVIDPDGNRIYNLPIIPNDVDLVESTMMWIALGKPGPYPDANCPIGSVNYWCNRDLKGVIALKVVGQYGGVPSIIINSIRAEKMMEFWQRQNDEEKDQYIENAAMIVAQEQLQNLLKKLGIPIPKDD